MMTRTNSIRSGSPEIALVAWWRAESWRHITTIFHDPETGYYGYRCHFPGHPPHHMLDTCLSLKAALDACDPHREHIWEERDADENALMISGGYKEGSEQRKSIMGPRSPRRTHFAGVRSIVML